jgi:hypothetical protein
MYVVTESVTLSWDDPQDSRVTYYEVQVIWLDQDPPMVIYSETTEATQIVIERPRTGHFSFRARSCSEDAVSEWVESINEEYVKDRIPFRVYFVVPPVEGGINIQ